jgi:hypothetical protein
MTLDASRPLHRPIVGSTFGQERARGARGRDVIETHLEAHLLE